MFSTNIHPLELADEAFLRRVGYKIEFKSLSRKLYSRIWNDVCNEFRVVCEPDVLDFVAKGLHVQHGVPLLPCHPRDLLGMAVDYAAYSDEPRRITKDHMQWAWDNYFVSVADYVDPADSQSSF